MGTTRIAITLGLVAACTEPDDGPLMPECTSAETGTLRSQTLASGDGVEDRQYWLHVPASYDCSKPLALLVDFHGTAANVPEEAYQTEALVAFADANRVI